MVVEIFLERVSVVRAYFVFSAVHVCRELVAIFVLAVLGTG